MSCSRGRPVVIDASAVLDLLLRQRDADRIESVLLAPSVRLHAPALLDREVLSATRRFERAGDLSSAQADDVVARFGELPILRHGPGPYRERVWALRHAFTIADGYYVGLCETLEGPLLTSDERLARGARQQVGIEVVDVDAR